jgi:hypothetical protein
MLLWAVWNLRILLLDTSFLHLIMQLFSHSLHTDICSDNHVITFTCDKRRWLVDILGGGG